MDTNYTPLGPPKTDRPWIRHGLGFLFIALAFLALIAYQIYNAHSVATANAQVNVENLATTLESKLEQVLREAQWEVSKVATDIDMEAMRPATASRHRPQISRWLKSLASPTPDSFALRVFDANGDSLYSSNDSEPAFNIADRSYFRQLQADPSIQVLFSDVVLSRSTRQPTIFVAKAVRDRNGAFLGTAVNGIELSNLHQYFGAIELGTEGIIAVRRLDNGAMVVRYPGAYEISNEPAMNLPMRTALLNDGRPGSTEVVSAVDGIRRVYGYRRIGDLPFFVVVGISAKEYLAGWRQSAFISLLTSLLFLASLAAVFLRLARAEARRGQTMALLQTSEQSYRALVDNVSFGVVVHGPDTSILFSNARAASLLGLSQSQMLGKVALDPNWRFLEDGGTPMLLQDYPVNRVIASGEQLRNYLVGVHHPGRSECHWLLCNAYPMRDAEGKIQQVVVTFADITERRQAEAQIQSLAFSDPLTGLPNRRLLMDRLEQDLAAAARHGHLGALLFIDMDDFKTLNDTLGHDKGDLLLKEVAKRLVSCVREGDTVARLSGDEFVLLLKGLSENAPEAAAQAQVVARKILGTLAQPYELHGHGHHSSASTGITLFGGKQRESVEEPLKRAELAMYQAKAAGRNTLRFFEPQMYTAVLSRASLESDLHQALAQGQFLLHYQPQGGDSVRLSGVEALVRWQHPQRGLVSPAEFIAVAEASGLILSLGQWVLESACKQLAAWASRPQRSHMTMAVNVSAREFRQPNFVEEVLSILQATGARPEQLKLELTESVLVDNVEDIIAKMGALKARGVGFSLDDFGTGYSSLSYLKRLPLDQLKIDRSFVRDILTDPDDAAIAKMVVALAESMGLEVIAEGVETQAQRVFLASVGCRNYQGFLLSRPLPIEEFELFAAKISQGIE